MAKICLKAAIEIAAAKAPRAAREVTQKQIQASRKKKHSAGALKSGRRKAGRPGGQK